MRKRIRIESLSDEATASGATTDTPITVCHAWAKILPLSGTESWVAKEQQELTSHQINMRYQSGITPKMRAVQVATGRVFNFTDVRDLDEMHEELEILAKEVLAS